MKIRKDKAEMNSVNMDKKKDGAARLRDIADDFLQFAAEEFPDCSSYFTDQMNENVLALLNFEKPKVMVYGIYNSGKSTLINALCREEVAQVADRPMTDQIGEYDRGDFMLVDSPGVDAPIAHERVTEEFLNKCHVILFVISTKGIFEDKDNYRRLAELIKKGIPFIIVLNDRGAKINKEWTEEEKKRARAEQEQELKLIQYKVIQNLIKQSGDPRIAEKYEVVILNAKKALSGVQRNKPRLYEASGVGFLDKRITQLLQNEASVAALFKQPVANFRECMNEAEKLITQNISGDSSLDFGMRLRTLAGKRDNILRELRIMTKQAVSSHLEELANSYAGGDADLFETVANTAFMEIEECYQSKVSELLVFADRNFKSCNLYLDMDSNLIFDTVGMQGSRLPEEDTEENDYGDAEGYADAESYADASPKKVGFSLLDLFKSTDKREKEKFERLEREAALRNERVQYEVQEKIRRRQEARQLAHSDLDGLYRACNTIVTQGMNEKYNGILMQIQEFDGLNRQRVEDGKRQMERLNALRNQVMMIENTLG